jgi:hypothetical protein
VVSFVGRDRRGFQFVLGGGDAGRVRAVVMWGLAPLSGVGGGRGDRVEDHFVAGQRVNASVDGGVGEELVLDLVLLGGAWRELVDVAVRLDSAV